MLVLANTLIDGFVKSNLTGQGIVLAQLLGSVLMVGAAIRKFSHLDGVRTANRRFLRDFAASGDVEEYYLARRPQVVTGIEGIYKAGCERLLKMLTPEARARVVARQRDGASHALTSQEIELIKGTCEHALDEEEIAVGHGIGLIRSMVEIAPMLGLLGTVWGVLDAFAEMGTSGSANLAAIAPAISAALVTTVVGLLIALPGIAIVGVLNSWVRSINSDMEGFVDELIARLKCEYQSSGAGA